MIRVRPRSRRSSLLAALTLLVACGDAPKQPASAPTDAAKALTVDSAPKPVDLSKLSSNIPKASVDTFTFRPLHIEKLPDAPPSVMDAAEREQGISRFCYQEFGQKADPKLIGAVAMVVTVERNAITAVRVGADDWSSPVGRAVNNCLLQKAPQAWKILPDAHVPDGKYVVQLQFRPNSKSAMLSAISPRLTA